MFGNELILRRPYAYTVPQENMSTIFLNQMGSPDFYKFNIWVQSQLYVNPILKPYTTELTAMRSSESLSENRWDGEPFNITFIDGEVLKIQKGTKIMKILGKIAMKCGCPQNDFENFRLWHSRILNQRTLDGELCLSIHPLDFMTMSDNNDNWSSCMGWISNSESPGDYRSGTIEMLNSPYVIIAYLHNPAHTMDADLTDWEWNSKKWRELFLVQDGLISEIKGYPYQDKNLTNTVLMWIKELASEHLGWEYDSDEVNTKNVFSMENFEGGKFSFDTTQHMYNDMNALEIHRARVNRKVLPKYSTNSYVDSSEPQYNIINMYHIEYGGKMTCMCCGNSYGLFKECNVFCSDCEQGEYCARCGHWIGGDEYWVDELEGPLCEECYEDEASYDSLTEEPHLIDNMEEIYLKVGEDDDDRFIFSDYAIFVYEPQDNSDFERIFGIDYPYCIKNEYGSKVLYVDADEVRDREYVEELFNVNLDDIDRNGYRVWTCAVSQVIG